MAVMAGSGNARCFSVVTNAFLVEKMHKNEVSRTQNWLLSAIIVSHWHIYYDIRCGVGITDLDVKKL